MQLNQRPKVDDGARAVGATQRRLLGKRKPARGGFHFASGDHGANGIGRKPAELRRRRQTARKRRRRLDDRQVMPVSQRKMPGPLQNFGARDGHALGNRRLVEQCARHRSIHRFSQTQRIGQLFRRKRRRLVDGDQAIRAQRPVVVCPLRQSQRDVGRCHVGLGGGRENSRRHIANLAFIHRQAGATHHRQMQRGGAPHTDLGLALSARQPPRKKGEGGIVAITQFLQQIEPEQRGVGLSVENLAIDQGPLPERRIALAERRTNPGTGSWRVIGEKCRLHLEPREQRITAALRRQAQQSDRLGQISHVHQHFCPGLKKIALDASRGRRTRGNQDAAGKRAHCRRTRFVRQPVKQDLDHAGLRALPQVCRQAPALLGQEPASRALELRQRADHNLIAGVCRQGRPGVVRQELDVEALGTRNAWTALLGPSSRFRPDFRGRGSIGREQFDRFTDNGLRCSRACGRAPRNHRQHNHRRRTMSSSGSGHSAKRSWL